MSFKKLSPAEKETRYILACTLYTKLGSARKVAKQMTIGLPKVEAIIEHAFACGRLTNTGTVGRTHCPGCGKRGGAANPRQRRLICGKWVEMERSLQLCVGCTNDLCPNPMPDDKRRLAAKAAKAARERASAGDIKVVAKNPAKAGAYLRATGPEILALMATDEMRALMSTHVARAMDQEGWIRFQRQEKNDFIHRRFGSNPVRVAALVARCLQRGVNVEQVLGELLLRRTSSPAAG